MKKILLKRCIPLILLAMLLFLTGCPLGAPAQAPAESQAPQPTPSTPPVAPPPTSSLALPEMLTPTPNLTPMTNSVACDWELVIKDSQEYMFTFEGETLKKIATIDLIAKKHGGTDYFGDYVAEGEITIFNAISPEEDAYPVYFGGQSAISKSIYVEFKIENTLNNGATEGYIAAPDRQYDGIAQLAYSTAIDEVRGIFAKSLDLKGLMARPGMEFQMPKFISDGETAMLYVDGGYVHLAFEDDWQTPETFVGTIIGVTPHATPAPTKKPSKTTPKPNADTPKPTATPAQTPDATRKPSTPIPETPTPATTRPPLTIIVPTIKLPRPPTPTPTQMPPR